MKKRFGFLLVMLLMVVLFVGVNVQADETIHVVLDGKSVEFDVPPQVINGRTMVPIRAIFETMGATVEWDADTSSAVCTKEDTVVIMTVDSMDMYINNEKQTMDISPVVIDGRTMAPARYVAEAFGASVQWSDKNNTVVICSPNVYAYADYPDVPDLGKCYNLPVTHEMVQDNVQIYGYVYADLTNDQAYSQIYAHSASVLGAYTESVVLQDEYEPILGYTKPGEESPHFGLVISEDIDGNVVLLVCIPLGESAQEKFKMVTLFGLDGSTIEVPQLVAEAYLNVGWYETWEETRQTLYAADGRTITVFKAAVPEYTSVGWYETWEEAQAAHKATEEPDTQYNPSADGYYYRTPTGKRYHLDPNCGGKNSYRTTNINGLTPCAKCAQ